MDNVPRGIAILFLARLMDRDCPAWAQAPLREYMKKHDVSYYYSYYYLNNHGIDNKTLQRLRHDKTVTTKTLAKLAAILKCRPEEIIAFQEE